MTREYPPEVYGGAGVHVTELVAQLRRLCEVDVHCMGAPREGVFVHGPDPDLAGANPALTTLSAELRKMARCNRPKVGGGNGRTLPREAETGANVPMIASSRKLPGSTERRPYAISIVPPLPYTRSRKVRVYSLVGTETKLGV